MLSQEQANAILALGAAATPQQLAELQAFNEHMATLAEQTSEQPSNVPPVQQPEPAIQPLGINLNGGLPVPKPVATIYNMDELIAQRQKQSSLPSNSKPIDLIVYSISDWKPTSTGLQTKRLDTDKGTFWPLAEQLVGVPNQIDRTKGHKASAVITAKDINGTIRLNLTSIKFEQSLEVKQFEAIKALPKGAALFASM